MAIQTSIADDQARFAWQQTESSLTLTQNKDVVWQLNYGKNEPKPCFHPLKTLEGTELTSFRPDDHPWHRALWFSWKFINGLNYWEEDPDTEVSEGITEISHVQATARDDYSAHITLEIRYHPPGEPVVLTEYRVLEVSAPSIQDGTYTIEWESAFVAGEEKVFLDRTPILGDPDGVAWGGYAGLSMRISPNLSNWQFVDSHSRVDLDTNKQHAHWVDFRGVDKTSGRVGGVTIFDHQNNPRHPTPWYVIMGKDPPFGYFSPAFLYENSYTLPAGSELKLRYQIRVHSGHSKSLLIPE